VVLVIYVFIFVSSNIFSLGYSDYLEDSIFFGFSGVNMTKGMAILVLISPLFFSFINKKSLRGVVLMIVITSVIIIILGVKRTSIISLFVGYFVFFVFSPQKSRLTKGFFLIVMAIFISSPFYFGSLKDRIEAREEAGRFNIELANEEEGRVIEMKEVINSFINNNISYKLFGAEFFNSAEYFRTDRMLHTDYTTMLAGSGIIGLSLFVLVYCMLFLKACYFYRIFRTNFFNQNIIAVSFALIIALIILGFAGTVTGIALRSIAFMFLGAAFSILRIEERLINNERLGFYS